MLIRENGSTPEILINLEELDKLLVTYDLKELHDENTNSLNKPKHTRRLKQQ